MRPLLLEKQNGNDLRRLYAIIDQTTEAERLLQLRTDSTQEVSVKVYVVRVLEIDYTNSTYSYQQIENGDRHGPFPSLASMLGHIHDKLLEEIDDQIRRQQ